MYSISTQLAKAVFNIGEFFYRDNPTESVEIKNGTITYTVGKSSFEKHIDSFFFMCKEWAINKNYYLVSKRSMLSINGYVQCRDVKGNKLIYERYGESEQQACFDACQWILDTKGV